MSFDQMLAVFRKPLGKRIGVDAATVDRCCNDFGPSVCNLLSDMHLVTYFAVLYS